MTVVAVALAGALGAPARLLVEQLLRAARPSRFPLGTFVVNVTGSIALGAVVGLTIDGTLDSDLRTIVGTGFLGAYTTFSTYAYDTVRTAEAGQRGIAIVSAVASVVTACAAAAIGLAITGGL